MIYILLAISLSTLIVVLFKIFPRFEIDNVQAIVVNYLVASLMGFALCKGFNDITSIPQQKWFPFALLTGFFLMFVFNVYATSAQKVGIAITAVSGKMSVVIPVTVGIVIYNENLSLLRVAGIVLALIALYLTFKKEAKFEFNRIYFLLPIILFLGTGTNDSLLNYTEKRLINNDLMFFLSSAFVISLIFGLLMLLIKHIKTPQKIRSKNIYAGIILGLLNFGSTYYFLICLGLFDSSVFFPVFNVSMVLSAALLGCFIFKEKLMLINWIGIGLAVTAILLIALTS